MKNNSIVKVFNIIVEPTEEYLEYVYDQLSDEDIEVAASLSAIDRQNLIQQLLPTKEFPEFIDGVEKFLIADDCVIDRSVDSNNKDSLSHYISFHKKSDESSKDIKLIFHVRISNHSFYDYKKEVRQKKYYRTTVTRKVENQISKKVVQSKYRNIVVGDKKVKDFSSLLAVATEEIHNWMERF